MAMTILPFDFVVDGFPSVLFVNIFDNLPLIEPDISPMVKTQSGPICAMVKMI